MQKPPSLTTITERQQPTQHSALIQQKETEERGGAKRAERDIDHLVCRKVHAKDTLNRDNQSYAIRVLMEFMRLSTEKL